MVYFVQIVNKGPIKIGYAVNPERRFKTIQGCNHEKLEIIAVIPGTQKLETKIHKDLKAHNIHGEWFNPHPELLKYIQDIQIADYETDGKRSWAILRRNTEKSRTDHCPFCGERHIHGTEDGHRVAHCITQNGETKAKDGTVLYQDHGYIIRTRQKEKIE